MASCNERYLALCATPARVMKEGWQGANAKIYLPFHGYWFASGETLSFTNGQIPQDTSPFLAGTSKPDTFQKNGQWCSE